MRSATKNTRLARATAVTVAGVTVAVGLAATATADVPSRLETSSGSPLQTVSLQLKWFSQGQFAGYLAAAAEGFYTQQGLKVNIINGGPDIVSENPVAQGSVDFAVAWPSDALASREAGASLVDVAQVFQQASLQEYSFKKEDITSPAELKGKKVGVNGAGNDVDVLAALTKYGLSTKDVTLVQQQGSIKGLLDGDLDAAQGSSYNEYGQLLSTMNPATGKLYTASDFNILNWNKLGTGMLEDGIWANSAKLKSSPTYQKETQEFVTASLEGWIYCRDNLVACRNIVVKAGSNLGASLQLFQVNGVNELIWPSPAGIGVVNAASWNNTVKIAMNTQETNGTPLLKNPPAAGGYTNTYVDKALTTLNAKGLDVYGKSYKPTPVVLNVNGA
jgi:NitT/TauT family transport system substrate-binding protein